MKTRTSAFAALTPILFGFALPLITTSLLAENWPQWRGPQRDGISQEKGLLKEWPKEGPKLLWQIQDCGSGYSTPSAVEERLYLLGNEGLDNEFVRAIAVKDGQRLWSTRIGKVGNPDQQPKFPGARSTPTVDGDALYALGSDGDLVCLEKSSGTLRWRKNLRSDFDGKAGIWAYSESPLIDGDVLICTPGSSDATLVALNKKSGELIWKCPVSGCADAAYSSAITVEAGGLKQYVQMLDKGLVGIDAKTGKLLWRFDKTVSRFKANIPSPVARDGYLYSAGAGTGGAILKLKPKDGAAVAEQVAFSPKLPTAIGGSVVVGDFLFGASGQALVCAEFTTGNLKWEERALAPASLCFADGRLYLHGENGEVALAEATPDGYREKGRFTPPSQPKRIQEMEKAWAYPVVSNGRLFIRDHGMLWCYDVKAAL